MWFILPIGTLICLVLYEVYKHWYSYQDEHIGFFETRDSLVSRWDPILSAHNPFYCQLSHPGKLKFAGRIKAFLNNVRFNPAGDFVITEDVKVRIGACATQLTWGYRKYLIDGYTEFTVFPSSFVNKRSGEEYLGATFSNGKIALSWEHFEMGYAEPNNGRNLGLHEMAHALKLNAEHREHPAYFLKNFESWSLLGEKEIEKMRQNDEHYLRNYAETNIDEFFAVSVEHLFERPAEFREKLPSIYYQLCIILRIDPENIHADYKLEKEKVLEYRAKIDESDSWLKIKLEELTDSLEDHSKTAFVVVMGFLWLLSMLAEHC